MVSNNKSVSGKIVPSVLQSSSLTTAASELRTLQVKQQDLAKCLTVAKHCATIAKNQQDDGKQPDLARRLAEADYRATVAEQ